MHCFTFLYDLVSFWTKQTLTGIIFPSISIWAELLSRWIKWMKVEASIPQHASETSGSLQALCQSRTSRQVHSLYVGDRGAEYCGVEEIDPPWEVLSLPLHDMRFEHKGRGHPARARPTHLCPLSTCCCRGTYMHTWTSTYTHHQNFSSRAVFLKWAYCGFQGVCNTFYILQNNS